MQYVVVVIVMLTVAPRVLAWQEQGPTTIRITVADQSRRDSLGHGPAIPAWMVDRGEQAKSDLGALLSKRKWLAVVDSYKAEFWVEICFTAIRPKAERGTREEAEIYFHVNHPQYDDEAGTSVLSRKKMWEGATDDAAKKIEYLIKAARERNPRDQRD